MAKKKSETIVPDFEPTTAAPDVELPAPEVELAPVEPEVTPEPAAPDVELKLLLMAAATSPTPMPAAVPPLVRVKFLRNMPPYNECDQAGFSPAEAQQLVDKGFVQFDAE